MKVQNKIKSKNIFRKMTKSIIISQNGGFSGNICVHKKDFKRVFHHPHIDTYEPNANAESGISYILYEWFVGREIVHTPLLVYYVLTTTYNFT